VDVTLRKTASTTNVRSGDLVVYALQVVISGNNANGTIVTDDLPPELTFESFGKELPEDARWAVGQTLTWNLGDRGPGTYTLTYSARVKDFTETGVALTNHAGVTWVGATPVVADASVTVTGDFTVRVGVYNEAGELVKEILVKQYSQPLNNVEILNDNIISTLDDTANVYYKDALIGTWDGTSSNGKPVANGEYLIKVDNIDAYGVVESVTKEVTVLRALSLVEITIYNEAGEAVRHLMAEVADPKDLVTSVQLSSQTIQPSNGTINAGNVSEVSIVLSTGVAVVWDGRNDRGQIVSNGEYYIEIRSSDGQGSEVVVSREVTVFSTATSLGVIVAAPNPVLSGVTGTRFLVQSMESLTVKVKIYNMAGEMVAKVDGVEGAREAWWDAQYVANGLYIAVVDVSRPGTGFLEQKILKVLVMR